MTKYDPEQQIHFKIFLHALKRKNPHIVETCLDFVQSLDSRLESGFDLVQMEFRSEPEQEKSRLRKKSGQVSIMDILLAGHSVGRLLVVHFQDIRISLSPKS